MTRALNYLASAAIVAGLSLSSGFARAADIVDTAVAAGSFTTLVTAVKAAGLVETLKGPGPFTVRDARNVDTGTRWDTARLFAGYRRGCLARLPQARARGRTGINEFG